MKDVFLLFACAAVLSAQCPVVIPDEKPAASLAKFNSNFGCLKTAIDAKAALVHVHLVADITGLQASLDGKAPLAHAHVFGDTTGLQAALDAKAPLSHVHLFGDITGLQSALDSKAPATHVHLIADISGLQAELNGKAAASHSHSIADVGSLQGALDAKQDAAGKGQPNGFASLGSDGKVPGSQLPPSSGGMTALVQDTSPQLGGNLNMNGHSIASVTPTEMSYVHGVTAAVQTQIDGKAPLSHDHSGVYEPVDSSILRQANLAGSGSAMTPARSDHNHGTTYAALSHVHLIADTTGLQTALDGKAAVGHTHSGVYEPVDAAILRVSGSKTQDTVTVFDANGKVVSSGCKVSGGVLSCGDATSQAAIIFPELAVNGSNDTRIYGASSLSADVCIVLPAAQATVVNQALTISSLTPVVIDGRNCLPMAWGSGGHTQNTDTGTTSGTFQIDSGNSGPRWNNYSGTLAARNAADSGYADLLANTINGQTLIGGVVRGGQLATGDTCSAGAVTISTGRVRKVNLNNQASCTITFGGSPSDSETETVEFVQGSTTPTTTITCGTRVTGCPVGFPTTASASFTHTFVFDSALGTWVGQLSGGTGLATTAYVDAGLATKAASNASTTVNGQTCTLGSFCTVTAKPSTAVRILGDELPGTGTAGVLQAADFTAAFAASINDANAKTLTEASCISDTGSQTIVVSVGGSARFTITCVVAGSYSRSTTDGSTGYISAASMTNTAVAAGAVLDITGTANGSTKDLKVFAYGTVN